MTISAIDSRTVLIVIDMQKGILATPKVNSIEDTVKNINSLIAAFRRHNLPIVLVNVTGGAPGRTEQAAPLGERPADWADLIPELDRNESDHLVTKRQWGAFTKTDLDDYLKSNGVTQVAIVGISTSIGVESTARHAHELGYNVNLITDAMTDTNPEAQTNSITRIFPRLGQTGSTAEFISLLNETRR